MNTAELTITHTAAEGTLVDGTSKGDGAAAILKANRWRWGRSLGAWFLPHSRDRLPNRPRIEATARALEADGWTVAVEIDDELRTTEEVEADKLERQAARVEALGAKVDRVRAAEATARQAAARAHNALPPGGEPIKVGHHSEGRHRRALQKADDTMRRAIQASDDTRAAERAYQAATHTTSHRYAPRTVANRIDTVGAELRRLERTIAQLADPETQAASDLRAHRDEAADQLAYWQAVRRDQIEAGQATDYGPDTIHAGDQVEFRSTWYEVVRANAKTVTLKSQWSTSRIRYHQLTGHRPATS